MKTLFIRAFLLAGCLQFWLNSTSLSQGIFSPDNSKVLLLSADGHYKLWNIKTGKPLYSLPQYTSSIRFSPNGKYFLGKDMKGTYSLWYTNTGQVAYTFKNLRRIVHTKGSNKTAFIFDKNQLEIWDIDKGRSVHLTKKRNIQALSPDGNLLAVTDQHDLEVTVWNLSANKALYRLSLAGNKYFRITFSPDGKHIIVHFYDANKWWNAQTGKFIKTVKQPAPVYSSDKKRKVSIEIDKIAKKIHLKLWDTQTNQVLKTITGSLGSSRHIVFSSDNKRVIMGFASTQVYLCNALTGKQLATIFSKNKHIYHHQILFSPNARKVVTTLWGRQSHTSIWNSKTGKQLFKFKTGFGVAFSPNGRFMYSGLRYEERPVQLWEVSSGKLLHTFSGTKNLQKTIHFINNGNNTVMITSQRGQDTLPRPAYLLETKTGKLIYTFF